MHLLNMGSLSSFSVTQIIAFRHQEQLLIEKHRHKVGVELFILIKAFIHLTWDKMKKEIVSEIDAVTLFAVWSTALMQLWCIVFFQTQHLKTSEIS